jgi:hypothetical protein
MDSSSLNDQQAILDRAANSATVLGATMVIVGTCLVWLMHSRINGLFLPFLGGRNDVLLLSIIYLLFGPGVVFMIVPSFIRRQKPMGVLAAAWTAFGQCIGALAVVFANALDLVPPQLRGILFPAVATLFLIPAAIVFTAQAAIAQRAIRRTIVPAFEPVMVVPIEDATGTTRVESAKRPSERETGQRGQGGNDLPIAPG